MWPAPFRPETTMPSPDYDAPSAWRKRPVEIEAMEFAGSPRVATKIIEWALASGGTIRYHSGPRECLSIDTLEGTMTADIGDWIIRGVRGEFYPCKPDIFLATYERVFPSGADHA